MKTFVFPYYISLGKNDNSEGTIECSLSDQMAKRLSESAREGGRYNLLDDKDIQDIFDKVLAAIEKIEKEAARRNLPIGILYPEDMQYLEQTFNKKIIQSECTSVVVCREEATEYLKNQKNKEKIIFIDDGKTLFYVPQDYMGTLIIPGNVRKIERRAVSDRRKITEILIEDGLECIEEWTFKECKRLKKVTIPSSVKKIDSDAFSQCDKLKEVVLAEGIKEIYPTAFRMCSSLKSLYIPKTVTAVSTWILAYYNGLKDIFFLGENTEITDFDKYQWRVKLHVKKDSKAETFAKKNGLEYEFI